MKNILSVLVENKAGVLSRISGLFSRRGFNIDSLTVGETQDRSISRMTIVVEGDEYLVGQVEHQLGKIIDVIAIKRLTSEHITRRELVLLKVEVDTSARSQIIDIVNVMGAKIVDISLSTLSIELCDRPERVDLLIELLHPFVIKEVARTGVVAMEKGPGSMKSPVEEQYTHIV